MEGDFVETQSKDDEDLNLATKSCEGKGDKKLHSYLQPG